MINYRFLRTPIESVIFTNGHVIGISLYTLCLKHCSNETISSITMEVDCNCDYEIVTLLASPSYNIVSHQD